MTDEKTPQTCHTILIFHDKDDDDDKDDDGDKGDANTNTNTKTKTKMMIDVKFLLFAQSAASKVLL